MPYRFLITATLLLIAAIPASGVSSPNTPAQALSLAAARLKEKDFKGASEAARSLPEGGERDFLLGIAAARLANWDESVRHLARATDSYPLLADFALYHQAQGLHRLERFSEAAQPLLRLQKGFRESPLLRAAELLLADALFADRKYQPALDAYRLFMEKYASGNDAVTALYQSGRCREELGDIEGAVAVLRKAWLSYPASSLAAGAEADLQRLAAAGAKVAPYSGDELLRRASSLYDLRKFDLAVQALRAIPAQEQQGELAARIAMKTGQALYKARRYREAERTFASLLTGQPAGKGVNEASFWLAKCLDKNRKEEEAIAAFLRLAETSPDSSLADDALLEAALMRKQQKKGVEAVPMLKRLLAAYPDSTLRQTALWETAWNSYLAADLKTAAESLLQLAGVAGTREKALYWYGRTLSASSDEEGAKATFATLLAEYPLGYYAHAYRKESRITDDAATPLPRDISQFFPLPAGFERAKALIAFGLHDEARKELAAQRKKLNGKHRLLSGIARLYLEMGDYHGAMQLYRLERPRRLEKDNLHLWGLNYPLAFREQVEQQAAKRGIPTGLVYAIIRAESSFFPAALSPAGAVGLMQLMPATAAAMSSGRNGKFDPDQLTRPEVNITLGVRHLQDLLTLYNGNQVQAIAAYNAGAGNVNRWLKSNGDLPQDAFIESIPFLETREYVKKVLADCENYNRFYGIDGRAEAASDQQLAQKRGGKMALLPASRTHSTP